MRLSFRNRALVAAVAGAGVLGLLGFLSGSNGALVAGAALLTVASVDSNLRIWRWSQRVDSSRDEGARMREWQLRPGFLIAYLLAVGVLAAMFLDAGQVLIALLTYPAAVVLLGLGMARGRIQEFLWDLLYPTRTPRRRHE